jgi:cytosine/adenosine deaminase-related metal-dependent hydrolase
MPRNHGARTFREKTMHRKLIKGAAIVSMDAAIGDLPTGDVLIKGDRIAAVAPSIAADDAEVIDASRMLLLPGLVNGHLHTWQTGLRGLAADWTVAGYMQAMHRGLATLFRPEDIHIANLVGALNQQRCDHAGRLVPQQPDAGA